MKVTLFGAGSVGSTAAFLLAQTGSLEIALIDVDGDRARGVALDIAQSLPCLERDSTVYGSDGHELADGSDLVIVTAGSPRSPGMSRADLLSANAPVIREIASICSGRCPEAVAIVVTNPLDEMAYLFWKESGFEKRRVIGMAGVLDTSRFRFFLSREIDVPPARIDSIILGSHGDEMVPVIASSIADGKPLTEFADEGVLEECVARTREAGAEIVRLYRKGSAYFAPAAAISLMALEIREGTGKVLPVSAYLDGEYGIKGVFLGVPARLGREGVREIIELPLSERELRMLALSAEVVRGRIESICSP